MLRIDIHQHLWPEPFVAELARRRRPPLIRRRGDEWIVQAPGEPESVFDLGAHDPDRRAASVEDDGLDLALVCISSPLGVESLAPEEAEPLIESFHAGVRELPGQFAGWGAVALADPRPGAVDDLLGRGFLGLSLPAAALAGRNGLARCAPLLARLEERSAPLLVHPGPAPWSAPGAAGDGTPDWWPPLTRYVAHMNAAWHAWAGWGRAAHPTLRVVFAALAGCAPLHGERLAARGGPAGAVTDPLVFYDTSSYGVRAIDAVVRCVGVDQLVHGSDRPVIEPSGARPLGEAAHEAMLVRNPAQLLWPTGAAA